MRVVGTAGHVDHGKSALVEALTGIHPDRLKEEREREMTIDLGFAWLKLPNGEEIGIVDVPGHRDFIENMLAGVGGIDAVLFVVAVDEGVMPQTREHLAIIDLLQIRGGVIVLTKIDSVLDPEWIAMVENEVKAELVGTVLEDAPIVHVSAKTKIGLPDLITALQCVLEKQPPRLDIGRPRLAVDRVFTMPGFGTIVTGTLLDGQLRIGEELEILPQGLRGRVRGLQCHKRKTEIALPGSRTAVNLAGVAYGQVTRGNVLAHPGTYPKTQCIDVQFVLLPTAKIPLKHNTEVKLFIGAAEIPCRVRLLGSDILNPGEQGWLQLELKAPTVAARGDRYILRRPSPAETIGGGAVIDPQPSGRHKRFAPDVLEYLQTIYRGEPADFLLQLISAKGVIPVNRLVEYSGLKSDDVESILKDLLLGNRVKTIEVLDFPINLNSGRMVLTTALWEQLSQKIVATIEAFHTNFPLRSGMPREEIRKLIKQPEQLVDAVLCDLAESGVIVEKGSLVRLAEFEVRLTAKQKQMVADLLLRFDRAPYTPPSVKESQDMIGVELYSLLVETGELVQVSSEVVFQRNVYEMLLAGVVRFLKDHGTITVAQARDLFQTSRRYMLAFLEHLDEKKITRREGDNRYLY